MRIIIILLAIVAVLDLILAAVLYTYGEMGLFYASLILAVTTIGSAYLLYRIDVFD